MSTKQRNELIEMHANIIMENYGKDERKHFMFEMEDTYTKKDDFLCALENHAYYSILVLVSRGGKRKLAKLVDEFWEEYQEANAEVEESDDEEEDSDDDDDDDETIVECKGCKNWIDNKTGFCSEGCRFGEIAGSWYCERCSGRCDDCEFCPDCGEEEDFATEWDKDLTTYERVALLAKTFDNKVESDDEEEEETWRCEECDRNDMKKEDIGGHLVDGGCICNDCYKEEYNFCYKNAP